MVSSARFLSLRQTGSVVLKRVQMMQLAAAAAHWLLTHSFIRMYAGVSCNGTRLVQRDAAVPF